MLVCWHRVADELSKGSRRVAERRPKDDGLEEPLVDSEGVKNVRFLKERSQI